MRPAAKGALTYAFCCAPSGFAVGPLAVAACAGAAAKVSTIAIVVPNTKDRLDMIVPSPQMESTCNDPSIPLRGVARQDLLRIWYQIAQNLRAYRGRRGAASVTYHQLTGSALPSS